MISALDQLIVTHKKAPQCKLYCKVDPILRHILFSHWSRSTCWLWWGRLPGLGNSNFIEGNSPSRRQDSHHSVLIARDNVLAFKEYLHGVPIAATKVHPLHCSDHFASHIKFTAFRYIFTILIGHISGKTYKKKLSRMNYRPSLLWFVPLV